MFSGDENMAIVILKEFSSQENQNDFIDMKEVEKKLDEEEVLQHIQYYLIKKRIILEHFNQRDYRIESDVLVKELIEKSTLSLGRIAKITGINRDSKENKDVKRTVPVTIPVTICFTILKYGRISATAFLIGGITNAIPPECFAMLFYKFQHCSENAINFSKLVISPSLNFRNV